MRFFEYSLSKDLKSHESHDCRVFGLCDFQWLENRWQIVAKLIGHNWQAGQRPIVRDPITTTKRQFIVGFSSISISYYSLCLKTHNCYNLKAACSLWFICSDIVQYNSRKSRITLTELRKKAECDIHIIFCLKLALIWYMKCLCNIRGSHVL